MPFGAFVNLLPGKDGMVHVSELDTQRVENVEDMVKMGDELTVMVIGVEMGTGKVSLSRRAVLTGESPEDRRAAGAGRGLRAGGARRGGARRCPARGRGPWCPAPRWPAAPRWRRRSPAPPRAKRLRSGGC